MSTVIHHIAAISSDLSRTSNFYNKLLGMRVIHKHSLFEGPKVCHFYWDKNVEQFITFYHCPGLGPGRPEMHTFHTISLSVAQASFHYWLNRLRKAEIQFSQKNDDLYHAPILQFSDPDGMQVQLVFTMRDERKGFKDYLVPENFTIKGFYAVGVSSNNTDSLGQLLSCQFGLKCKRLNSHVRRFYGEQPYGSFIDVYRSAEHVNGFAGWGRVHHIALWMEDWKACANAFSQIKASKEGVICRVQANQFSSLYFRESDVLLFELLGKMPIGGDPKSVDSPEVKIVNSKKKLNT
jgi:glyoxalase family protein